MHDTWVGDASDLRLPLTNGEHDVPSPRECLMAFLQEHPDFLTGAEAAALDVQAPLADPEAELLPDSLLESLEIEALSQPAIEDPGAESSQEPALKRDQDFLLTPGDLDEDREDDSGSQVISLSSSDSEEPKASVVPPPLPVKVAVRPPPLPLSSKRFPMPIGRFVGGLGNLRSLFRWVLRNNK